MTRTHPFRRPAALGACAAILSLCLAAGGEDWPTYMHDNARSGVTPESVPAPMTEQWVYRAPAPPRPAWAPPQPGWTELPKVRFDDALYTVADADQVYVGSSVDHQVYALDARTGAVRWKFFTGGPVRLAPTLAQGRLYVGSDDGKVYCLRREDGGLVWSFEAAQSPRRVLGNGRVTSLWPVRTSILVEKDRVYFGAGVFPYHRVLVIALDAANGGVVWKSPPMTPSGGFSPQGYLLSVEKGVIAPAGRASPVCLDWENGKLVYSVEHAGGKGETGGVYGLVADDRLYVGTQNTIFGIDAGTGESRSKWTSALRMLVTSDSYYVLRGPLPPAYGRRPVTTAANDIACYDRQAYDKAPKNDLEAVKKARRWRYARADLSAMVLAGKRLVTGRQDEVAVLDVETGKEVWAGKVDGLAVGLAVAHGRLLVSTTKGTIHCFAPGDAPPRAAPPDPPAWPAEPATGDVEALAKGIIRESGVTRGYALVTGHGAARLAVELARRTDLMLTCVEFDAAQTSASRQRVDAAGLYGWRVAVEDGAPDALSFPDYAANLVVHVDGPEQKAPSPKERQRVLKPCGGVAISGTDTLIPAGIKISVPEIRGPLPGSGWWTHQYADAGNSGSSGDQRVKGELEALWFGEPGPDWFPDRHQRGSAPLVLNGRVFCQGWRYLERKSFVLCFDAYNGLRYWEREVPGALRLEFPTVSGNLACSEDSVFVAAGAKCYRLDAVTGEIRTVYETPVEREGKKARWAYLAVADGLLLGSAGAGAKSRFSDAVFAIDIASGQTRWVAQAKEILDATIVCSGGRLFLADNRLTPGQPPPKEAPKPAAPEVVAPEDAALDAEHAADDEEGQVDRRGQPVKKEPMLRTVVALDVATGRPAWEKELDLVDCGRWNVGLFGCMQALCRDDVLVLGGAYTHYSPVKPEEPPRRVMAVSARDGSVLWSEVLTHKSRPIIMHGALLAEPFFYNLRTGEKVIKPAAKGRAMPWTVGPRSGGCGPLSASDAMVFGRGGYTIWKNVLGGPAGALIGVRPGCSINIIPAGGVVVHVEASSGCSCYQAVQCTIAFKPKGGERP